MVISTSGGNQLLAFQWFTILMTGSCDRSRVHHQLQDLPGKHHTSTGDLRGKKAYPAIIGSFSDETERCFHIARKPHRKRVFVILSNPSPSHQRHALTVSRVHQRARV